APLRDCALATPAHASRAAAALPPVRRLAALSRPRGRLLCVEPLAPSRTPAVHRSQRRDRETLRRTRYDAQLEYHRSDSDRARQATHALLMLFWEHVNQTNQEHHSVAAHHRRRGRQAAACIWLR